MTELSIASQSSLLLPQFRPRFSSTKASLCLVNTRESNVPLHKFVHYTQQNRFPRNRITAVSDSTVSNLPTSPGFPGIEIQLDSSGGGGFGDGGSGGGGGGGDDEDGSGPEEEDEGGDEEKRSNALSMSQKLTLGYAALVGFGGLMGFLKGGSQKSLAAGGFSALILYYVFTQLPSKPVFASSIGLGMSAALLVVMGSRFRNSGKVMPAGVVSLVSLVMTGGYLHGIFRAAH